MWRVAALGVKRDQEEEEKTAALTQHRWRHTGVCVCCRVGSGGQTCLECLLLLLLLRLLLLLLLLSLFHLLPLPLMGGPRSQQIREPNPHPTIPLSSLCEVSHSLISLLEGLFFCVYFPLFCPLLTFFFFCLCLGSQSGERGRGVYSTRGSGCRQLGEVGGGGGGLSPRREQEVERQWR